jgi:nicotinamide-nucleotide amidase
MDYAEIITIGNEILSGHTVDTNSAWISEKLRLCGIPVIRQITVGDIKDEIIWALSNLHANTTLVFVTGGLGPTHDDITKITITKFFGDKLIFDENFYEELKDRFERRGVAIPEINKNQAFFPSNAKRIPNVGGSAQGMEFQKEGRSFFVMPGVPYEMKGMMEAYILPRLSRNQGGRILEKNLRTTGIMESVLYEKIRSLIEIYPGIRVAFLPQHLGVDIRLTCVEERKDCKNNISDLVLKIKDKVGKYIYTEGFDPLEAVTGKMLAAARSTLSVAESCTGGLVFHRMTNISGSSAYMDRGVVAYSNQAKVDILGVPEEILIKYGAVSEETAIAMAKGIRKISGSTYGISTTGIAGPTGGTEKKPLGTTFMAIAWNGGEYCLYKKFTQDRLLNKEMAAQIAINLVRLKLLGEI